MVFRVFSIHDHSWLKWFIGIVVEGFPVFLFEFSHALFPIIWSLGMLSGYFWNDWVVVRMNFRIFCERLFQWSSWIFLVGFNLCHARILVRVLYVSIVVCGTVVAGRIWVGEKNGNTWEVEVTTVTTNYYEALPAKPIDLWGEGEIERLPKLNSLQHLFC